MSFFRLQIMITPFVLFLPSYYVLLPFTHSDYSFCLIFVIAASPSSGYRFWLLLLCYFCHCIMSFFCLQILITPFVLFLLLQHLLLPDTDYDYSFVLFLPLYYVLLPFTNSNYSFCDILPLYYVLLLFIDPVYSFCVIFAIAASPSSGYRFWLLLFWYFCHCIMSFFRLKIMVTPFVLCLPLYYVLLLITDSDYSFCVIFATAASPSSGYRFWLLLLCCFCHCIMSFFRLQIMITPFVLFLPLYYVLLPFTNYDYSFCVIFAIVLCPSSVYTFWLLLLSYFCHCSISFFRIQILITPFVLFLPLYYVLLLFTDSDYSFVLFLLLQHLLLPDTDYDYSFVLFLPLYYVLLLFTDSDYSFCVIFATAASPSSGYRFWLLLLCYFCHYSISFFRIQILITPFVLFLPLYYVLLPFTDSNYSFCDILPLYYVLLLFIDPVYSFCVIFAIAASPSSEYRFWLLLLSYFCHYSISFFRIQILITPFVLFLPLYYVLLPFTDSNYSFCDILPLYYVLLLFIDPVYSFCVIFAIAASPSSGYRFWLLLLWYFCHCIMSFFRLKIMVTPFVLCLPLFYVLLPLTDSDYSFCVIFCHCIISFFRLQILITPFVLFMPLYYVLLLFTDSEYSFCVIFATAASPSSGYRFWLLLFILFLPLHCALLQFTNYDYPFCVIFAIVLCPSSVYTFWLLLLTYFCHCSISFFRIQILITPFLLFLPLYYVLLLITDSDYSFCVIFATAASPYSGYRFWLLLLCCFRHCIMSFFRLQILITPFVLVLPLYYVLLPFTHSDYSFCVIFAIVLCPSSVYKLWLLLLCYFCHCIMSFFRLQIMITPFVLFLPLYYVLLPFTHSDYSFWLIFAIAASPSSDTDSDYSFCVIFAIVLCPSSVYRFWLLLLCYLCHCSISFFRLQILITPFVLFLPLYYVLLPFTNYDYSFCVSFAIVLCPSSVSTFWLLLLCYVCHCIMSFFRLQIMITPFVLFLPLYYVLLPFPHSDYSFCVMFAIVLCPSSVYKLWLLLLCYFCHCIKSFFCLQILITPFVLFLPLQHLLLPGTDSDYSFCVIFAITASPSSEYRFWLLLLSYFCHCIMSFFRLQILITPFVIFSHCIMSFFCL